MGNASKRPATKGRDARWRDSQWRIIGQSVRGASHIRADLPNQDAIHWSSKTGPPIILAVSDGHGSPKSFRSDLGSRFAVENMIWLIENLLAGQPDPTSMSAVKRTAEERLPQEVVRHWQQAVDEHLKKNPFTSEELETLEAKQGAKARRMVEDSPYLAYGATILSVLVTDDFILYFQLGDGDILVVMDDNQVLRPLPEDTRLFANQTTSLCTHNAWRDVRLRFQGLYGPRPAMILLSTDGYANSFINEAAFLKVGSDILDIMRTDGPKFVENDLETWLNEASLAGSGDDITLGILYRVDALEVKQTLTEKQAHQVDTENTEPIEPSPSSDKANSEATPPTESPPGPTESTAEPEAAAPETEKHEDATSSEAKPSRPTEKAATEESDGPELVVAPKRKRRIKDDEEGPLEPSKKIRTDLFFED